MAKSSADYLDRKAEEIRKAVKKARKLPGVTLDARAARTSPPEVKKTKRPRNILRPKVRSQWLPGQTSGAENPRTGRPREHVGDEPLPQLTEEEAIKLAKRAGLQPLEYLMSLLRDQRIPVGIKLDAAKAAAPYLHRKMPIAIEGGDADRPIRLDAQALRGLSRTEIGTLRALLVKTGLVALPEASGEGLADGSADA